MSKKYQVGFAMSFDKVEENGKVVPAMRASVDYFDMDYADAVEAEACIKPTVDSLFALGVKKLNAEAL